MKEFEEKIKEIFYLIGEYGITHAPIDIRFPDKITQENKKKYLTQVYKGYRLGQQQIIEQIIPLLEEKEKLKSKEAQTRKLKDKKTLQRIAINKNLIEYKIRVLRHFADFIAWQIFKNDYYKARRFFSGSRSRPDLLHSNLQSVLHAVDHFHDENELNFALITDLTTFIDIGDLLVIKENRMFVVECKEGEVQRKVYEFIGELEKDDFDAAKIDYSDKGDKFFEQVKRTLKQMDRGGKAVNFLNTEKGPDPFLNTPIQLYEAARPREYYFHTLTELIETSKKDISAYCEIEEIIYVAVYRGEKIGPSRFLADYMAKINFPNYILVDYLGLIGIPLKEPLFFKPIGKETIFDLMFNRLKIYLVINLDAYIALFNKKGFEARWLSTKETQKYKERNKGYKPFIHKNRTIQVLVKGKEIILGDSFIIHLLFDNLTPSWLVDTYYSYK